MARPSRQCRPGDLLSGGRRRMETSRIGCADTESRPPETIQNCGLRGPVTAWDSWIREEPRRSATDDGLPKTGCQPVAAAANCPGTRLPLEALTGPRQAGSLP